MSHPPSLFAQKLRGWRTSNGTHGRMTQEALAELLDVSVDAIGKYERSLSYIRGDMEHRLAERLGWSNKDVLACRQDWQLRNGTSNGSAYQLLDDALVDELFGGSWEEAARASVALADSALDRLPEELAVNEQVFVPIYTTFRNHWGAVLRDGKMVAKWTLPFLLPEDEKLLRQGNFIEQELSVDRIHKPIFPGTYYGYCPALIVSPGHEGASTLLFSSFTGFLEDLARRDVFLHGIGAITCSPSGAQICRDLGMKHICNHCLDTEYGIWDMSGADIAQSLFAQRSPLLKRAYSKQFC